VIKLSDVKQALHESTAHDLVKDLTLLDYAEAVMNGDDVGDVEEWTRKNISERNHNITASVATKLPDKEDAEETVNTKIIRADYLRKLIDKLPDRLQLQVYSIIENPDRYNDYLSNSGDAADKILVSETLRKFYNDTKQVKEVKLSVAVHDVDKAMLLSKLYKSDPDMFALLVKCGSVDSFMELLRIMDGKTIIFPKVGELQSTCRALKSKKTKDFTHLLSGESDSYDSDFMDSFAIEAAKKMVGAAELAEDSISVRLANMSSDQIVRTYSALSRLFNATYSRIKK